MPTVNDTESLRQWFRQCPSLSADNRFGVDYLSGETIEYSIFSSPSNINYRQNVLGEEIPTSIQTINFIFAAQEPYGSDVTQNLDNLMFFQSIVSWIMLKNSLREFPEINEGTVKSIVPTLTAYPAEVGSDAAKYQIQLKLTYKRNN